MTGGFETGAARSAAPRSRSHRFLRPLRSNFMALSMAAAFTVAAPMSGSLSAGRSADSGGVGRQDQVSHAAGARAAHRPRRRLPPRGAARLADPGRDGTPRCRRCRRSAVPRIAGGSGMLADHVDDRRAGAACVVQIGQAVGQPGPRCSKVSAGGPLTGRSMAATGGDPRTNTAPPAFLARNRAPRQSASPVCRDWRSKV